MQAIIENFDKKILIFVMIGLLTGIGLGLVLAWVVFPVNFVDATPIQLRADLRDDYMRMAIESYSVNKDIDLAIRRYEELGAHAAEAMDSVGIEPQNVADTSIQNFKAVVEIFHSNGETAEPSTEPDDPSGTEETNGGLNLGNISGILMYLCLGIVILGGALGAVLILRNRRAGASQEVQSFSDSDDPFDIGDIETRLASQPGTQGEPLATFRTIYSIGDDLYDDSFSIESPSGDFLGECGVGIGDIVGVGEPKKVSGFEVWLFDKNDIQTVTKVVLSDYAYNDESTVTRLAAKGDPVMALDGGVTELQTASLRIEARIVEMTYGEGPLPQESFFERVTFELRAWPRTNLA